MKKFSSVVEYKNEFNRKNYDQISLMIPKGQKEIWRNEASARNMSMSNFIQCAVANYIAELTEKKTPQ